jgi:hypothetical protein
MSLHLLMTDKGTMLYHTYKGTSTQWAPMTQLDTSSIKWPVGADPSYGLGEMHGADSKSVLYIQRPTCAADQRNDTLHIFVQSLYFQWIPGRRNITVQGQHQTIDAPAYYLCAAGLWYVALPPGNDQQNLTFQSLDASLFGDSFPDLAGSEQSQQPIMTSGQIFTAAAGAENDLE